MILRRTPLLILMGSLLTTSAFADPETTYFREQSKQCADYFESETGTRQIRFCRDSYAGSCQIYYLGPIEGQGIEVWAKINNKEGTYPMRFLSIRSSGWYRAEMSCDAKTALEVELAFVNNTYGWDSRYGQNYRFSLEALPEVR